MPRSADQISRHLSLGSDGRSSGSRLLAPLGPTHLPSSSNLGHMPTESASLRCGGSPLVAAEWQGVGRPASNVFIYRPVTGAVSNSRPGSKRRQVSVLLQRGASSIKKRPPALQAPMAKPESLAAERLGKADGEKGASHEDIEPVEDHSTLSGDGRRISIVEAKGDGDGMSIIVEKSEEEPMIFTIFEAANIDGVQHLSSKSRCTRYTWFALILVFVCMCAYQIGTQAALFWWTPIATNIAAVYPTSVPFPVVAICNNNQYRLNHLTDSVVQDRLAKPPPFHSSTRFNASRQGEPNVFDKALANSWDMDAVNFLREAGHKASKMVLKCQWPNGTRCSATRDFRPIWTLTGLCWAINSDGSQIHQVTGAGPGNSLRLLLNVERYERIESCSGRSFRTTSLPGLKILIYNQSDAPVSSLDGVNAPPGYTIDIPFRMQQREKLPSGHGPHCLAKGGGDMSTSKCVIANYMKRIEARCNCSMKQAFAPQISESLPFCNVWEYFHCVQPILQDGYEHGFATLPDFPQHRPCLAPCQHIDYTAWQDIQELPSSILPEYVPDLEESEGGWNESMLEEEERRSIGLKPTCQDTHLLSRLQVARIKKEATKAYEKQARYQEDIVLRTKNLITRVLRSSNRLRQLQWGPDNEHFSSVNAKLATSVHCYAAISINHLELLSAIKGLGRLSEETKTQRLHLLLDERDFALNNSKFGKIADLRGEYGHRAESKIAEIELFSNFLPMLYSIFTSDSFTQRLSTQLHERLRRVHSLIASYASEKLTRQEWASRMRSRNMRHFIDEDFYEAWYNPLVRDLDEILLKVVEVIREEKLPLLRNISYLPSLGAVFLFGNVSSFHTSSFSTFLQSALDCALYAVKQRAESLLVEFQTAAHDFHSACVDLFDRELGDYTMKFEFGRRFARENFVQVNVFLHKMNIEVWRQEPTYSIWSLFCDIGGALGLFLGASLLTLIEVTYFLWQTKIYNWLRCTGRKEEDLDRGDGKVKDPFSA